MTDYNIERKFVHISHNSFAPLASFRQEDKMSPLRSAHARRPSQLCDERSGHAAEDGSFAGTPPRPRSGRRILLEPGTEPKLLRRSVLGWFLLATALLSGVDQSNAKSASSPPPTSQADSSVHANLLKVRSSLTPTGASGQSDGPQKLTLRRRHRTDRSPATRNRRASGCDEGCDQTYCDAGCETGCDARGKCTEGCDSCNTFSSSCCNNYEACTGANKYPNGGTEKYGRPGCLRCNDGCDGCELLSCDDDCNSGCDTKSSCDGGCDIPPPPPPPPPPVYCTTSSSTCTSGSCSCQYSSHRKSSHTTKSGSTCYSCGPPPPPPTPPPPVYCTTASDSCTSGSCSCRSSSHLKFTRTSTSGTCYACAQPLSDGASCSGSYTCASKVCKGGRCCGGKGRATECTQVGQRSTRATHRCLAPIDPPVPAPTAAVASVAPSTPSPTTPALFAPALA